MQEFGYKHNALQFFYYGGLGLVSSAFVGQPIALLIRHANVHDWTTWLIVQVCYLVGYTAIVWFFTDFRYLYSTVRVRGSLNVGAAMHSGDAPYQDDFDRTLARIAKRRWEEFRADKEPRKGWRNRAALQSSKELTKELSGTTGLVRCEAIEWVRYNRDDKVGGFFLNFSLYFRSTADAVAFRLQTDGKVEWVDELDRNFLTRIPDRIINQIAIPER